MQHWKILVKIFDFFRYKILLSETCRRQGEFKILLEKGQIFPKASSLRLFGYFFLEKVTRKNKK